MKMAMDHRAVTSNSNSVVSIECLKGGSKADEWTGGMLQTGDIVEELRIGRRNYMTVRAPFKNGRAGIQKLLHSSFRDKETSIFVRVKRGNSDEYAELQGCIVPNEAAGKKQYMLRSINDPNYAIAFMDRTQADCIAIQGTRNARLEDALAVARLQDGYVQFPWEKKMREMLLVPNSSCFLSVLFLPKAADEASTHYNDLDDTLARANAWLSASQSTGVPLVFMNIQTELLLTKISGEKASSTVNTGSLSDLSNLAGASLYGFEDYHGVDIGVVRAVRLWYSPLGGEMSIEIKLKDGDTKLGFAISRTEEGFIYISSVIEGDEDAPSSRSGLNNLYKEAIWANKRLVISRVCNKKVLPWIVSQTGAIRCFDTVSLSQKLSLHRHAKVPITLHVFLWDRSRVIPGPMFMGSPSPAPISMPVEVVQTVNVNQVVPLEDDNDVEGGLGMVMERDTAGESSFRFHDFALPNNWV
ncbi:uncharacterized protein LOC124927857 [Impatiens glandulifera]|uniref:uncharacterized protein LOC124927857 n=1 Tax=Impatiens glandulifera TaxID=253017 RepID=UPI001FB0EEEB|nr:uncharacterized protein LOC124927857 [Impatiens glandulifera]